MDPGGGTIFQIGVSRVDPGVHQWTEAAGARRRTRRRVFPNCPPIGALWSVNMPPPRGAELTGGRLTQPAAPCGPSDTGPPGLPPTGQEVKPNDRTSVQPM